MELIHGWPCRIGPPICGYMDLWLLVQPSTGRLLCQLKSASTDLKVAGSGVQKHAKADVALPCLMDLLWCLTFCVKNRWRRRGHGTKGDSVREGRVSLKRPGWGRRALGLHRNPATAGFVGYQDTRGQGAHTRGRFQRI